MEPQQQPGQLGHNPYDFILNPPKPTSKHPLGGLPVPGVGRNSLGVQIAVLVGGAVIVMIVIGLVVSALTGSKLNTTDLINLAAEQTELASVATTGGGLVTEPSNQQLAIDVQLTVDTDNHALLNFLASDGVKVSPKQLQADSNAETTVQLQSAEQSSTVDTVFAQTMQSELQTYANNIKKDYNAATDSTLKGLLKTDYTQAQLLLKQVPTAASTES